jgi:hypothetical protein
VLEPERWSGHRRAPAESRWVAIPAACLWHQLPARLDNEARLSTAADASGNPHFLPGGHTAVITSGPDPGLLVNTQVREFVIDGGMPGPAGSILFELGPDGERIPLRRF